MLLSKKELQAFIRNDFVAFVERSFYELNPETQFLHNWHIDVIAEALEQCRLGTLRRLIINLPPRSLKSHMTSIAFVAWLLGHNPAAQIICASYAQDLADKLAGDCRSLMTSEIYQELFPATRLAARRQAIHDFTTTETGFRLATSVGGVLTGRGAQLIIIDDPLRPDEALSETRRQAVNEWYNHTLVSRLNDKRTGSIILIMQRLHEEDLVGHVLKQGDWRVLRFPAIAEGNETHIVQTPYGLKTFSRCEGEALHPQRESLEMLARMREIQGEYNFAGQYQQAPAPLGGGLIKVEWFKTYITADQPSKFDFIFQSWDTANKPTELSDFSVCTTWGFKDKHLYLLHVYRKRIGYPELKRAVREQAEAFGAKTVLIEDRASGTQLIQEMVEEGMHSIQRCESSMEKIMRMNSVTSTIENGFVHLPATAAWLGEYLHELAIFPKGKHDDQVDSTSQALNWVKNDSSNLTLGLIELFKRKAGETTPKQGRAIVPQPRVCTTCGGEMNQIISGGLRCMQCGTQWSPPSAQPRVQQLSSTEVLNRVGFGRFGVRIPRIPRA
jgi:predicted phage terminase large subunit-like protein